MRDFSLKITKFSHHGGFIFGVSDFLLILRAEYVAVVHPVQNTNATLQSKNNIHMKSNFKEESMVRVTPEELAKALSLSSIISPRCFNRLSWSEKSIACLVYCILPLFDVTYTL